MAYKPMNLPTPTATRVSTDVFDVQAKMASQKASFYSSLANRLESFTQYGLREASEISREQASEQAVTDVMESYQKGGIHNLEDKSIMGIQTVYSRAYENSATATYASMVDIDLTETSKQLSETHRNDPSAYTKSMSSYLESVTKNAPTPELKATIQINGTKLKNRTSGALFEEQARKTRELEAVTFLQDNDNKNVNIISLALEQKDDEVALLKQGQETKLQALIQSGAITPAEAEKIKYKNKYDITRGVAIGSVESLLAQGFEEEAIKEIEEYRKSDNDLGVRENETLDNELSSLLNAYYKRKDADEINTKSQYNAIVKEATKVLKNGYDFADKDRVDEAIKSGLISEENLNRLNTAKVVYSLNKELSKYPLSKQQAILSDYKKDTGKTALEVEAINTMQQSLNEKLARSKTDSQTLGAEENYYDLVPIAINDEYLSEKILDRNSSRDINKEKLGAGADQLFTKQERDEFSSFLADNSVDINNKMAFISEIASLPPEIANDAFRELSTQKQAGVYTFAGRMLMGGNTNAAKVAVRGASSDIALEEGFQVDLKHALSGVFANFTTEEFNLHYAGVVAYAKGKKIDNPEDFSVSEAIEESIGKIRKYNGKRTVLPPNVKKDEFEDWLDKYDNPDYPNLSQGIRDMTDFMGSGEYQLFYKAPGEYFVKHSKKGMFIQDKNKKPFVLKWGE